jgi:hypothetical protein
MEPSDLYGLPLERFVEERDQLSRELRRQGRRDEAAQVAKLRKPSVVAWAVNQLVRTRRHEVDALLDAGDSLQKAQANLLARRADASSLREAVDAERAAVDQLVDTARGLLGSEGHELSPVKLEQVAETLQAAALDAGARARVRDGCLDRELRHIGLGSLGETVPAAPSRSRSRSRRETSASRPQSPQGKQARGRPKGDDGARATRLKAARQDELRARRHAERTERDMSAARERRDRAAGALQEAEERLARARAAADQAAEEHQRAKQALESI